MTIRGLFFDEEQITQPRQRLSDADDGGPDHLSIGRLTAYIVAWGDRMAMRVKNPQTPTRTGFHGLEH